MELLLDRKYKKATYTIGKLYVNGKLVCDTCEDKDRGLTQTMPLNEIKKKKVYGTTAIPTGRYKIVMNQVSYKFADRSWAKPYQGKLPRLLQVPGFERVLIHVGNSAQDSLGCILAGNNKAVGKVLNSTNTFRMLMDSYLVPAARKGEEIWITIK